MSLDPGAQLLHYRLVDKLGEGGMGEVWRAVDTKLDREVAIKVLPEAFAANPERIERFQREAKAVARLSHPNIVTVYAVEHDGGTRFVAMEMVHGRPLAELIPRKGFDLGRLFDLAIPLADAVAAAHRQGVTHRDLKPGNVMVGDDGRVKVLDFGLAKLAGAGAGDDELSQLPTRAVTEEGRILGTVAYMSPEQGEGKPVDHRSDIFSLGIVLYEMATGGRPFTGETPASTLSSILRDTPPSVTELRSNLPPHFGRIVRRCLAKDPERRYQTAQDLRNELEELRAEVATGEWTPAAAARRPRRPAAWAAGLAAAIALLLAGYALRSSLTGDRRAGETVGTALTITPLTRSGMVEDATLSADGRYLVYVSLERGLYSLRVRQLATGSDQELIPPGATRIFSPVVSPDLEWVHYGLGEAEAAMWRIPILGGRPQQVVPNLQGEFAFSPDGSRLAFQRGTGLEWETLAGASDGSGARRVGSSDYAGPLAWSADGQEIFLQEPVPGRLGYHLVAAKAGGGSVRRIGEAIWNGTWGLAALPGGRGLVISGVRGEHSFQLPLDLWLLDFAEGGLRRLTHGAESYDSLSVDRSGEQLVAVQVRNQHSVWVVSGEEATTARRVAFTSQSGPYWAFVSWLPDGRLFYEDLDGEELHLWAAHPDGSGAERLTTAGSFNMGASVSPDGTTVAYFSNRDGEFHIWLSDLDGTNARRLTDETAQEVFPRFSPDGRWIVYHVLQTERDRRAGPAGDQYQARRVAVAGGPSVPIAEEGISVFPVVSPDGGRVAYTTFDPDAAQWRVVVADFDSGEVQARLDHEFTSLGFIQWAPDGKGIAAAASSGGATNIVVLPLDGGPPRQVTRFTEGRVFGFAWDREGRSLAAVVSQRSRDAVLITGFAPAGD